MKKTLKIIGIVIAIIIISIVILLMMANKNAKQIEFAQKNADVGMGYVGFLGPVGFGVSATYFILNAAGIFQGWGDPLTTPKR